MQKRKKKLKVQVHHKNEKPPIDSCKPIEEVLEELAKQTQDLFCVAIFEKEKMRCK